MPVQSLTILPAGFLTLDRSILVAGTDMGVKIRVPVYAVLLMHDEGPILVDAGMHPLGLTEPERAWGPRARIIRPEITAADMIEARLAELGVKPADLRMVILTHMHWDHTGGLAGLRDCPIVVQWAEHRFAFAPDGFVAGQYMRNHIDVPVAWEPIEGDRILVPGVSVIRTTGHSPGHQSVLVRLDSGGWYLITGDAVSTLENVQLKLAGSNVWDAQRAAESISRLEHLGQLLGAELFPSHDGVRWEAFRKTPDCYR